MKKTMLTGLITAGLISCSILSTLSTSSVQAADYKVDVKGAHAFIQFKIKHLGYSWLLGRFNTFDGGFSYDSKTPNSAKINIEIETKSIDSNHSERDKHLKGSDFLDVSEFPKARFISQSILFSDNENAIVTGEFTLKGVTKKITFPIVKIGEGKDPWGGYRAGFSGTTSLKLSDYGITYNLGPASTHAEIALHIEGIRL
jgi:polyisoprenoid-binding protein YceI